MAKKKSDDTKGPGYDDTGYIGKGTFVRMTYRVAGLADNEQRERVREYLWQTFKRGIEAQMGEIGPRVEGSDVTYSFLTILTAQEASKTAELQVAIAKLLNRPAKMITVVMTHAPAPEAPEPVAGIDALAAA